MRIFSVKNEGSKVKQVSEDYYKINLDAVASLQLFGYYHEPLFSDEWLVDVDFGFKDKMIVNFVNEDLRQRFNKAQYLSIQILRNDKLTKIGI
jgi:hypothetical protein